MIFKNVLVAILAVAVVILAIACVGCTEKQPINKFEPGDLIVSGPGAPSGEDLGMAKVTRYDEEYDKYYLVVTTKADDGGYWVYDDIGMWIEREYVETWFEWVAKIEPDPVQTATIDLNGPPRYSRGTTDGGDLPHPEAV